MAPSGFEGEPAEPAQLVSGPNTEVGPDGALEIVVRGRREREEANDNAAAAELGAAVPPTDVDTTGSSYEPAVQPPMTTAPQDWTQHPLVQLEGGFLAGVALGRVPFGSSIGNALTGLGSQRAEIGRAIGEIVGGGLTFLGGVAGMLGGGAATGTGDLAIPGAFAVVGSAALAAGGIANVYSGAERLGRALAMSSGSGRSGSGSTGPQATALAGKGGGLADLAKKRAELGLPAGEGTLARLDVGGKRFYGINAHGQPVAPLGVNAISATHAEADAFAQAARAGMKGGSGTLYVDRALCSSCGTFGGVRSMARQLGLESLEVITPSGTFTITP